MPELPSRPHLDHLRHEARQLLRAAQAGDPDALRRINAVSKRVNLSAAQLAIARQYGWRSWPALRHYVEVLNEQRDAPASPGHESDDRFRGMPSGVWGGLDLVEELRQQARNLLRAAEAGDPDAIDRLRSGSDRATLSDSERMTPAAAELTVAGEHGWVSFSPLRAHIEEHRRLRAIADSPTDLDDLLAQAQTLLSAAQGGDPEAIERMHTVSDEITLSVAQDTVAHEYCGWANWAAFCDRVESLRRIFRTPRPPADPPSPATILDWQERAVERWADFPVEADPRPVVLTGGGVQLGEPIGNFKFVESDFKRAFALGMVEGAPGVPDEPVELLRRRRRPDREVPAGPSLILTRAERSKTEFWTDRGRRDLSAWRIESSGARGVIWALDEAGHAQCWVPPPSPDTPERRPYSLGLQCATLFDDGVTLRVRFRGELEAMVAYGASVLETSTAVCIVPVESPLQQEARATASWPLGDDSHSRELTVRLDRPLGGRVLVGHGGYPVTVISWTSS